MVVKVKIRAFTWGHVSAVFSALVLSVAATAATAALDGRKYYMDGFEGNCAGGTDEGIISVADGRFSVESTIFSRSSELKTLGDGWVEARYAASMEGESMGIHLMRVRAEDETVTVGFPDGEVSGKRCH